MNFFEKLKRRNKKEYMKYEDGKIIPVEVAEHRKIKDFNSEEEEEFDIKTIIKENVDVQGTVKKYGTLKTVKIIGAIGILLFFIYTIKDVYVAFTEEEPPITEVATTPTDIDVDKPVQNPTTTNNPERNEHPANPNSNNDTSLPTVEQEKQENSDLKIALDSSIFIENEFLSQVNKDIGSLNGYLDNKINKNAFERNLNKSLATQEKLLSYLFDRKKIFQKEDMEDYYILIESRLINSIALTNYIKESYQKTSETSMLNGVNNYIQLDSKLKEEHNLLFVEVLKAHNIPYTFLEDTKEIQYTIK